MNHLPRCYSLGVLALALLMFLTVPVLATETEGTIINVNGDAKEFVILDRDNSELTFRMADDGKVMINGMEADVSELQSGDEVSITFTQRDEQNLAREVRCNRNR